jgi:cytochrome c oxidase subunit 4
MINVIVALTIATIKASLVALFFMHLLHDKPVNSIILVSSFVFLGIFLISCYTDVVSRDKVEPVNMKPSTTAPATTAPATNPAPGGAPAPAHH